MSKTQSTTTQPMKMNTIYICFFKFLLNQYSTSFLVMVLVFLIVGSENLFAENNKSKILIVHSYNQGYASYPNLNKMIMDNLKQEGIEADFRIFYLDCDRYSEDEEIKRTYELMETMGTWKPDLIMVNDDQATYSLLCSDHPILRTIPIVFCGVHYPNWNVLNKYSEITGFWDKPDYMKTISMVERIMGKMRIRLLYDNTYLGKQAIKEVAEQFKKEYPEVYKNLREDMSRITPDSIVRIQFSQRRKMSRINRPDSTTFHFVNLRERNKNEILWEISGMEKYSTFIQTKYDYTTMRIGRISDVPTFSVINEGFDYNQGILGGYITTLDIQAAEGATCIARILKGEKASQIPIVQSSKKYVIDWNELTRWNINHNSIPPEYEIIHMPFYVRYRSELIAGCILLSILIATLIFYLVYLYSREGKRKREAQLNLQKEKEFLSLALEGGNIFVWKCDLDNDLITFDKKFFDNLHIIPQTYTSEQMWTMVHSNEYPKAITQFKQIKEGKQNKVTLRCRCDFNGQGYIWYEFRYTSVVESNSIIGLILNIQEFKNREHELTEARDLAAKTELKQSFLANMSHEIRTPLNAIVGFSNLLTSNNSQTKEEKQEFIDIINRNCELLLKLIGDILEISRIESDNLSFTFQTFCLNKLIEDIYTTHQMMMPANVRLLTEIPQEPVFINSDKLRLNQVITNFVNNAVKFTASGSITVGYEIKKSSRKLFIYVKDTGKGIPDNEQKMIFERFYKRDEFVQGTGLGLSISQGIVEKLGGEILLKSKEGQGSTFTIVLPYNPEEKKDTLPSNHQEKSINENINKNNRKTILIAEDNESNYMLLETILHKDYDLVWVKNGKDAVREAEEHSFDLVLMDIKMPEMNGIEALKEIRKTQKHLPVIMQTAYAFEADREEAIMEGCSGFITKPIIAPQLLAELRNLFQE